MEASSNCLQGNHLMLHIADCGLEKSGNFEERVFNFRL